MEQLKGQAGAVGAASVATPAAASPSGQEQTALARARSAIASLTTPNGFYAGNDYRQYWTRDVGYSAEVLIAAGYGDTVEAHLKEIFENVSSTGEIPARVQTRAGQIHALDPLLWAKSLEYRGKHALDHHKEFASNYHPGEADNPLIFLVTVKTFERLTGKKEFTENDGEKISRILQLVETLKDKRGMIAGSGWFDAMMNYRGKYTLHNQIWLYKMYKEFGMQDGMQTTKGLLENFWSAEKGYYVDYENGDHLDTLSNAMLLEEDLVPEGRVGAILAAFEKVRTEYGYLNLYPTYPESVCYERLYKYQNSTIWPFVEYHLAKVFVKYGKSDEARGIETMMAARKGVNEWYSPIDGKPDGSKAQLWTAAAYLGVAALDGGGAAR